MDIGEGNEEENIAVLAGSGTKSIPSSEDPDKTLTEYGLTELEVMARAKATQKGHCLNVASGDGIGRLPTVNTSSVLPVLEAACTKL